MTEGWVRVSSITYDMNKLQRKAMLQKSPKIPPKNLVSCIETSKMHGIQIFNFMVWCMMMVGIERV